MCELEAKYKFSTDIFTHRTLTERFRASLSVKRSVLFFSSSQWMHCAPVFDVPWTLAVALVRAERARESLIYMQNWRATCKLYSLLYFLTRRGVPFGFVQLLRTAGFSGSGQNYVSIHFWELLCVCRLSHTGCTSLIWHDINTFFSCHLSHHSIYTEWHYNLNHSHAKLRVYTQPCTWLWRLCLRHWQ